MSKTNDVPAYYDRLTQLFLRFGITKRAGAIHRAVRLSEFPDISPDDTVHVLIADTLRQLPQCATVADLGCGVGASMVAVSRLLGDAVQCSGITISHAQAEVIRSHPVTVASYDNLPYADASLDAVWAIESFAHSHNPSRFFAEVARVLRPHGICIICDDMRTSTDDSVFVDVFKYGWMVPNVNTSMHHATHAHAHGLVLRTIRDLTPGVTIYALPTGVAQLFFAYLHKKLPRQMVVRSMLGSWALQQCYAAQQMAYQFIIFEKKHA